MTRPPRILRFIGIAAVILIALVGLAFAAAVLLVDFDPLIEKHKGRLLTSASDAIGREVKVQTVEPSWFPTFGVEIGGLSVAGPDGREPMLEVRSLLVDVGLLEALFSLGKSISVDELVAEEPRLIVSRDAKGRMSYADILERLEKRPDRPMPERTRAMIEGAHIDRIAIEDGALTFIDHQAPGAPRHLRAHDLDVDVSDVALGSPLEGELAVALFEPKQNLFVELKTGPLPETVEMKEMPSVERAVVDVEGVPLQPLLAGAAPDQELRGKVELTRSGDAVALTGELDGLGTPVEEPLRIDAEGRIREQALELTSLIASLGSATLRAEGVVGLPAGERPGKLALSFSTDEIALEPLGLAQAPASLTAKGRLSGRASLEGARLEIQRVELVAKDTQISGSAAVDRFDPPHVRFDLSSDHLDSEALQRVFAKQGPETPPSGDDGALAKLTGRGSIHAKEGRLHGWPFRDLDGEIRIKNGRIEIESLTLASYGGRVSGAGTWIAPLAVPPRYRLSAQLDELSAGDLFADKMNLEKLATGRLHARVDLSGRGTEWESIAETLDGLLSGSIQGGRLDGINLVAEVLGPLAEALPFVEQVAGIDVAEGTSTHFRRLRGTFRVNEGTLLLRDPMEMETDAGTIELDGSLNLKTGIDLEGTFHLTPDTIVALTGNRIRPKRPVPVGLVLGCTLKSPCVKSVAVEAAAQHLIEAAAGRAVDEATKKAKENVQDVLKDRLGL